jgi:hypothetical protein
MLAGVHVFSAVLGWSRFRLVRSADKAGWEPPPGWQPDLATSTGRLALLASRSMRGDLGCRHERVI